MDIIEVRKWREWQCRWLIGGARRRFCRVLALILVMAAVASYGTGAELDSQNPPVHPDPSKGTIDTYGRFRSANNTAHHIPEEHVPRNPSEAETQIHEAAGIKEVRSGVFSIGRVTVNQQERTVSFPARVNMRRELVEYALVTEYGKKHESILVTDARPDHIHLACILFGMRSVPVPSEQTNENLLQSVRVEVTWERNGPPARLTMEQLVTVRGMPTKSAESIVENKEVAWMYNGSEFGHGGFSALSEGSIISIIPDSSALINNMKTDRMWPNSHFPNEMNLPDKGKPVTVVMTFNAVESAITQAGHTAP